VKDDVLEAAVLDTSDTAARRGLGADAEAPEKLTVSLAYRVEVLRSRTNTLADRSMIQRAPKVPELGQIIAAQRRHRKLFERSESQTKHALPKPRDETIPSKPSLIVRAADRLRLSDIPIWHVERASPSFVPQRYEPVSISALPPVIGFEDDAPEHDKKAGPRRGRRPRLRGQNSNDRNLRIDL
jgi:hypothetical protein